MRWYRASLRSPRWVIAVFAALTCFCAAQLPKTRTLLALEDNADPTFTSSARLAALRDEFKVHTSAVLWLREPDGGWTDATLCHLQQWLSAQEDDNRAVVSVFSPLDVRRLFIEGEALRSPPYLLVSCLDLERRVTPPAELRASLDALSAGPWGFMLTGRDGKDWLVQLNLADGTGRTGTFDPRAVDALHQSFETHVSTLLPALRFEWLGTADSQYFLFVGLKRVNLLNGLLLVLLVLLFRWIFGTWRAGLLFCGTLIISGLITYGLMALFGVPIDILSKSLFLMIAVASVEDAVYLLARTLEREGRWRGAWRQLALPGFLTSLTTVVGFASLCTSDVVVIRRFGGWSAVGAFIEWAVIFLLLPAVLTVFPSWSRLTRTSPAPALRLFERLRLVQLPRRASLALLGVFLLTPWTVQHLEVHDTPLAMFPADHPLRRALGEFKARNGWETSLSLVVPAGTSLDEEHRLLEAVRALPGVTHVTGGAELIDFFVSGIDRPGARRLVERELRQADFMRSWVGPTGARRAVVLVRDGDVNALRALAAEVEQLCVGGKCHLAGVPLVYAEFSQRVPRTLLTSFLLSLVLVAAVLVWLAFSVGQQRHLAWVLLSAFWGPAVMFAVMAAFSVEVNFLTCVSASVLVGLTGDNAIQFLVAGRRAGLAAGVQRGGGPALVGGFLMALGSLVFLGSYFVPPRVFGLLLAGGFLASTLGDFWLLQGLVTREKK